jgi:hypothetical protein
MAFAEITIVLAYLFRTFKISLPSDFVAPEKQDFFALEYSGPGLQLKFMNLADKEDV